jgi:hypothetical protein
MNVKELIAKFSFSHVMCLGVGVLIPIYCDVLFFHGFDSSTISAIMDTVMAGSAIYAAYKVHNWLNDRVKNKGYEHAESILVNIHSITQELFELQMNCKNFSKGYMNGTLLNKEGINYLKLEHDALIEQCNIMYKKSIEILVSLRSLSSWDMICHLEKEYILYIHTVEDTRSKIEQKLLNIDTNNTQSSHIARQKQWATWEEEFKQIVLSCSEQYAKLDKRFESAFKYEPSTK